MLHMTQPGTFFIVGTPIGNREDITLRALRVLSSAEVIMCEDTRVTQRLLSLYSDEIWQLVGGKTNKPHLARLDEAFEQRMIPKVINWLETGTFVVLVTDAGMPTISDPGWRVVEAVRDAGYGVEVVPGPTALTAALATSGINTAKVWFPGFLPKKLGKRQEVFQEMIRQLDSVMSTAVVFYESPNRVRETLEEISNFQSQISNNHLEGRFRVAACGELTKQHERVIRGTVEEVLESLPADIKGEWVLVVGE